MKKLLLFCALFISGAHAQDAPYFHRSTGTLDIPYVEVEGLGAYSATLNFLDGKFAITSAVPASSLNIGRSQINGTYKGESNPPGPFATDSTTTTISIQNSQIDVVLAKFFTKECRLAGTIAQDSSVASGTYQCADFTSGTWSSNKIQVADGVLFATFSLTPLTGQPYTLKVVGLRKIIG